MSESGVIANGFDYGSLATDQRAVVQGKAAEIKQAVNASVVTVGRLLVEVRGVLPHGQFAPWCRAEFPQWKESSIQQFMNAARLVDSNPQNAGHLESVSPSALIELARPSTPEPVREAIVAKVKNGTKVTAKDVKEAVKVTATRKPDPLPDPSPLLPSATPNPDDIPDDEPPRDPPPAVAQPVPQTKPDPEPWAAYNAGDDRVIEALQAVKVAIHDLHEMPGLSKAFSAWIDLKQWDKYVADAVTLFKSHHVERFATNAEKRKLPDGQTFVYSLDLKRLRGVA